ncbi:Uu.00g099360.m01.CDS01 [Anthostomella pinea]|uniref:Uu.00g099360.m01.CDS01 n=1 Tax=Anthostomella pinea TaxID=933095 RepID=A0AAI8VDG3_9PEZI|nr:Uu.00g099360.m01.CDS01 [Anthostomella pinea]
MRYVLFKLTYQSGDIIFADWITLFTLCLAPLIVHVLSGAPRPSYLTRGRPPWHERFCHYNPTSILWRYAAIADRRIRARSWDALTMAASNALFWTPRGWDGSEEMVAVARPLTTRLPEHTRVEIFSKESLLTVIITLQGTSAVYSIAGGLSGATYFNSSFGLDAVFFPVAVFGLLRLCAAFWLTEDYHFGYTAVKDSFRLNSFPSVREEPVREDLDKGPFAGVVRMDSLLQSDEPYDVVNRTRFRPTSYWPSILFRALWMVPVCGLWVLSSFYVVPFGGKYDAPVTSWLVGLMFLILFTASGAIYAYYFVRGRTTTTLIPCISAFWYKIYTVLIFGLMVTTIAIACVETKKTPCGRYTSLGGVLGDITACRGQGTVLFPVGEGSKGPFALASSNPNSAGDAPVLDRNTWMYNFTGTCIGRPSDDLWVFSDYYSLYNGSGWVVTAEEGTSYAHYTHDTRDKVE